LSKALILSCSPLPLIDRIDVSARRAKPILRGGISMISVRYRKAKCAPRTPVCHLPKSDRIDTLINTSQPLPPPNVSKNRPSRRWVDTGSSLFMTRDFGSFHARAEACFCLLVACRGSAGKYQDGKLAVISVHGRITQVERGEENEPMVRYACAIPPPIPPMRPAAAGLSPAAIVRVSISDAVKMSTAPLVEASIQA
jgi:hypothetical protein